MIELYGHKFSSYTWKPLIALYTNGTEFEFRQLGPGEDANNALVQSLHPAGKFPVLVDGETTIFEATTIIEYLAVHHGGHAPLIPVDPAEAVTARMLDRVFDNYVQGSFQRIVNAYLRHKDTDGMPQIVEPDAAEIAAGQKGLRQIYAWLERWLGENTLPRHVSLVTCSAAPALFYADWCDPIPQECQRLRDLRAELLALPPVQRCVEDARYFRPYFPPGAPDRD